MKVQIKKYKDLSVLSNHAAEYICTTALDCVKKYGFFTLVLSGGSTPKTLFENLARSPLSENVPWDRTHLFWCDERCVPPDHPESNFFMAYQLFISRIPIPARNIHRMQGEMESPFKAAEAYERELYRFFHTGAGDSEFAVQDSEFRIHNSPSFHLILLGIGKDGHTASLFPGDDTLAEESRWVVAARAPQGVLPAWRITLTLNVINQAEQILFLVSGSEKREIVRAILNDTRAEGTLPAARIRALKKIVWYVDYDAI